MDIHVETLLEQIKLRPVLWDITSSMYKNKILKKEAWAEVCSFLVEGYAEKSNAKKDYIERRVLSKWRTVRDGYAKYRKKERESFKSDGPRKLTHKYIYSDHLSFLDTMTESKTFETNDNVYCEGDLENSKSFTSGAFTFKPAIVETSFSDTSSSRPSSANSVKAPILNNKSAVSRTVMSKKKKRPIVKKETSEYIKTPARIIDRAKEDNDDLAFFRSLLPIVKSLNQEKKLEFRMGVMSSLQSFITSQTSGVTATRLVHVPIHLQVCPQGCTSTQTES